MIAFSNALRDGDLVTLRGSKYVRLGRTKGRISGVYQSARQNVLRTVVGTEFVTIPQSVIVSGPTSLWVDTAPANIAPARARTRPRHKR